MAGKGRGGDGITPAPPKNGRKQWDVRVKVRDQKTGLIKDTKRRIQADSYQLAVVARVKLLDELASGVVAASHFNETKTLGDVAGEWISTIKVHGTRVAWGSHTRFIQKDLGAFIIDKLSTKELQAYLGKQTHLAPGSLRMRKQVLRRIYGYALDKGYLAEDPTERLRPMPRPPSPDEAEDPPKRALTADEVRRFFAYLEQHEPDAYPLARTQLIGGMRFAEVSALKPVDLEEATGVITIRRGQNQNRPGKTKAKYARRVAVDPETLVVIKRHRAYVIDQGWPGAPEVLFPRPPSGRRREGNYWSLQTISATYKRAWAACKLPPIEGATHVLRRSAVDLVREHVSQPLLQLLFGHRDPELSRLYSSAQAAEAIEAAAKIGEQLKSGNESGNSLDGKTLKP